MAPILISKTSPTIVLTKADMEESRTEPAFRLSTDKVGQVPSMTSKQTEEEVGILLDRVSFRNWFLKENEDKYVRLFREYSEATKDLVGRRRECAAARRPARVGGGGGGGEQRSQLLVRQPQGGLNTMLTTKFLADGDMKGRAYYL